MYKLLFLLTVCFQLGKMNSYAQSNSEVLGALFDSQEDIEASYIDPQFDVEEVKVKEESLKPSRICSSKDQNSLPLRMVLGLLRGKGAKLVPSHKPSTGTLNIFGGQMIANCNSMLDFVVAEPSGELPYSFEVKIKGCGKDICPYKVFTVTDDLAKDEEMTFEPTMNGFISCLENTGVFKDGKVVKNKIFKSELDVDKKGVNKSSKLVFVSKGPAAINMGGAIFSKKNLYKNDECKYYEDIKKDGYELYSKSDIDHEKLMKKAISLCDKVNYAEIYQNIDNFKDIAGTYYGLERVMQKDLLEKVKKAKKELKEIIEDEDRDLSEADTEKYAQLFDDFYKLIVDKQLSDNNHNEADEENSNLLVNLHEQLEEAETKSEKAAIEKKIRDVSKKLSTYMEEPYFTPEDFGHFLSLKDKAPIKDPMWKKATLSLQKSLVSLRASCQAYNVDNSNCKFDDDIKDMMSVKKLNKVISSYTKKAEKVYAKKEKVLKNTGEDESEYFAEKINECKALYSKSNQNKMILQQYAPQMQSAAQQYCQNKNPYVQMYASYGSYYVKKYQSCITDQIESYQAKYYVSETKLKLCDSMVDKYQAEYDSWSKLESQRDEYYGGKVEDVKVDKVTTNKDGSYSFNYNNGQTNQNAQGMKNWYEYSSQQAYNNARMQNGLQASTGFASSATSGFPMYSSNNYSMTGYPNYGQSTGYTGYGSGLSFNAGIGNTGYGYNSYGRQPSYYGNTGGYYGNVPIGTTTMPGAMTNYLGSSTMPGGAYSFGYNI